MKIRMVKDKETKGTWRYAEPKEGQHNEHPGYSVLKTVYVVKDALTALGDPDEIVVTIEASTGE